MKTLATALVITLLAAPAHAGLLEAALAKAETVQPERYTPGEDGDPKRLHKLMLVAGAGMAVVGGAGHDFELLDESSWLKKTRTPLLTAGLTLAAVSIVELLRD